MGDRLGTHGGRPPTRTELLPVLGPPQAIGQVVRPTGAPVTAGVGMSPWLVAAIALPLAYVGYSEFKTKKKNKRKKKAA